MIKNAEEFEKQGKVHFLDADRYRDFFYSLYDVLFETTTKYFDNFLYDINVEDFVYGRIIDKYSEEILCFHDEDNEDEEYTSNEFRQIYYVWSCFRRLISVSLTDKNTRLDNKIQRIQNKAKFKNKIVFEEYYDSFLCHLESLHEALMRLTVDGAYLENNGTYYACMFELKNFALEIDTLAKLYKWNDEYVGVSFSGMEEKKKADEYAYIRRCVESLDKNVKDCIPLAKKYISELRINSDTYKQCLSFTKKLEGVSSALDRLKREINGQKHFDNTILYSPKRVYNMRKDFIYQAGAFSRGLDDTFRALLEEGDLESKHYIDEYNEAPKLNTCLYKIANGLNDLFVIAEGLKNQNK